jgi:hypothetical protein
MVQLELRGLLEAMVLREPLALVLLALQDQLEALEQMVPLGQLVLNITGKVLGLLQLLMKSMIV